MKIAQKKQVVEALREDFSRSESVAFVDYSGLGVQDLDELRSRILAVGGKVQIAKNTLIGRAMGLEGEKLTGPTAVVFSFQDPLSAVKVLAGFKKEFGKSEFRGGLFFGSRISASEVVELSEIPEKGVLLFQVGTVFESPLRGFLSTASNPLGRFANVLNVLSREGGVVGD